MVRGAVCVSVATMLYGLTPVLSRGLYDAGVSVSTVVFWRSALVIPFLLVIAYCNGSHVFLAPRRALKLMLGVAVFGSASSFCVNTAYSLMDTGLASTIYFLYPVIVVLITAAVYRRVPARSTAAAAVLIGIGMALVGGQVSGSATGIAFALIAATVYAIYIVRLEVTGFNDLSALSLTLYIALSNALVFLLIGTVEGGIGVHLSLDAWRRLVCLSFITLCALGLIGTGSRELDPGLVAVFGLFEPLTSLVVGVVLMGEHLSVLACVGCALIFCALVLASVGGSGKRTARRREGLVDRGVNMLVRYL